MPIELRTIFGQLESSFQLLNLLRSGACREALRQTVLDESLTVLIPNFLHVNIAYELNEISHRPRRFLQSSGSDLPLRAYEAVLEKIRESHRYWPSDIYPQLQFLLIPLKV
jgi:hypothetical protein